jgi:hypothetical protein
VLLFGVCGKMNVRREESLVSIPFVVSVRNSVESLSMQ